MATSPSQYAAGGGARCPVCKSEDIEGGAVEVDAGSAWQPVGCNACNANWNDIYTLSGYAELELSD